MDAPSVDAPPAARLPWHVFPWWSLQLYRAPLAFLVLVLIIPLGFLCWWVYAVNEHQWRAREANDLRVYAQLASRTLQEELQRVQQLEEVVAAQPALLRAVKERNRAGIEESLALLARLAPSIGRALVTDSAGRTLAGITVSAAGALAQAKPLEPMGSHGPRRGAEPLPALDDTPAVSAVYLYDLASGEKAVGISAKLRDDQVALGMLHAHVRLGAISHWLEKIRIEPEGFLYVVDDHGLLVSYPFQLLAGTPKDVSDWPAVARSRAAVASAIIRFRQNHAEPPWTAAVVSVAPFSWRVIAQQSDAAMLKPLRRLAGWFAAIIAVLSGLISIVVLRWVRMHQITLSLLAKQAELLKRSQQDRVRASMRSKHIGEHCDG